MSHKIAIIIKDDVYDNYGDDYHTVIRSITDWTEVTHEDYLLLYGASNRRGYQVLERPVDIDDFIRKTVAEEVVYLKEQEEKLAKEKKRREETARLKKYNKDLKDKESKLALLRRLQEELGEAAK